ncbi:gamma-glutamyl-gamma-aminobutyrate hydrolase family protein [Vibrio methylphosphonaticus]|uniref:gamma-glutamyl-gamma-aminobutyrate hydrolase family protein n=1 Tax=Vibrio methylphosphonaticus TaxID=2946866 RepID=UPI00202AA5A0|nr:gamma-glutamyl-gamma-aminobutyrate hydrolase family protein [Vibrio methylphosphonaticus]MCL9775359.1 gamma-glutamyl-gamma-aminobutyrate hydrolase family protein [Vibrio methylphosphonaticus]
MSEIKKPMIGLVSCRKSLAGYQIQALNEFYLQAIKDFGGTPIILPSSIEASELDQVLSICDGLVFPGSHSNVAPHRYNGTHEEAKKDEDRDELAITLIRHAIDKNIPCLGICRGFQEMNVALGGSLDPAVHESGYHDHRENPVEAFEEKYAPAHPVLVEAGGVISKWLQKEQWQDTSSFEVNTLHNQGVKTLASALKVEAKAPDGLVEAFSLPGQKYFVGVQWHPEWQAKTNHFSQILFKEFIMSASD